MKESIKYILKEQKELSLLGGIGALLGWDQMTYMPPSGAAERAEQSAYLSQMAHKKIVSNELWEHVKKLNDTTNFEKLSDANKNIVKRLYIDLEKARKIPTDFVEKFSKTTTLAYQTWEKAREKNDFKTFAPKLSEIVELEKEYCQYINLPGPKYNSLLDDYEEGMTVYKLKEEFSYLKTKLIGILDKIKQSSIYEKQQEIPIKLDVISQKKLCRSILEKMKLTNDKFRIDESTHPFTTSMGSYDVRITTNYHRKSPLFSFFSTIHEAGHGLYESNMPQDEYKNTVISDSPSLGLHESQSRFWENMIARSKPFWKHYYQIFKDMNSEQLKNFDLENLYRTVNQVEPSLIRVEADELTYCLHVILRFEIEVDLIQDKIKVDELSTIWNQRMNEMLGIEPKNDLEGVLQDMHWSGGSFGYFPTYAIGTIYASQLYNKMIEENPGISKEIENGKFENIIKWLIDKVHKYGRLETADDIVKNACGTGLNSKVYIDYLSDKYLNLYEI